MTLSWRTRYIGTGAVAACALSLACTCPAFGATADDIAANYKLATTTYNATLLEQEENAKEITQVTKDIKAVNQELEQSKENLSDSAVAVYKHERNRSDILGMVLESESLTDAIVNYDNYMRIQNYWTETVQSVKEERHELGEKKEQLVEERDRISDRLLEELNAVEAAKAAMRDIDHSDGARYHQKQGNGSNCGATSFIVGVNVLLHQNRYKDNVAVWNGPGFGGDSTQNLGVKGSTWLMANGLADEISCKALSADIHFADQLKAELEQGSVVIISSGSGSNWQRADGSEATGVFPDGHWIVFYYYKNGIFYANDSSVSASKGAGCAYTTAQMQQWLDGRENHFATVLSKKHLGQGNIEFDEADVDDVWEDVVDASAYDDASTDADSDDDADDEKSDKASKKSSSDKKGDKASKASDKDKKSGKSSKKKADSDADAADDEKSAKASDDADDDDAVDASDADENNTDADDEKSSDSSKKKKKNKKDNSENSEWADV